MNYIDALLTCELPSPGLPIPDPAHTCMEMKMNVQFVHVNCTNSIVTKCAICTVGGLDGLRTILFLRQHDPFTDTKWMCNFR